MAGQTLESRTAAQRPWCGTAEIYRYKRHTRPLLIQAGARPKTSATCFNPIGSLPTNQSDLPANQLDPTAARPSAWKHRIAAQTTRPRHGRSVGHYFLEEDFPDRFEELERVDLDFEPTEPVFFDRDDCRMPLLVDSDRISLSFLRCVLVRTASNSSSSSACNSANSVRSDMILS